MKATGRKTRSTIALALLAVSIASSLELPVSLAFAVPSDSLARTEERIRKHTEKILAKVPGAEQRARGRIKQAQVDAVGKQYNIAGKQIQGPKEHPWLEASPSTGANPNFIGDYIRDSFVSANPITSTQQTWSCFEPQLIAKGFWGSGDQYNPASIDLALTCKLSCPPLPPPLPDNGYEVVQFWWPEHHIAVNNYARSRFNPAVGGPFGSKYTRQALISAKEIGPEKEMKRQLEQNYPLDAGEFKGPDRTQPFIGQGMWGGEPGDTGDRLNGHVYRTLLAAALGDRKPKGLDFFFGWLWNPRSIYLSLAPSTGEKPIANLWTEYGMFEAITAVPQLSYMAGARGSRAMNALFGPKQQVTQVVRNNPNFFQSQGSAAFRVGRWGFDYGALQDVAQISPDRNAALRESVFHGGQELFPLTLTLETNATPTLSTFGVFARRAAYLAGTRDLVQYLPGAEMSRINEYTVNGFDNGREIDKLQRIFPTKGGPSECYRSQRIPNMVEQTEDGWVAQNFPHDMMGYVHEDFGDVAYTYWNKRVACSCRVLGVFGGSWAMDFPIDAFGSGRGTGDRPYGKLEVPLCEYPKTQLSSGFAGEDRPACPTGKFGYYKGLDDGV